MQRVAAVALAVLLSGCLADSEPDLPAQSDVQAPNLEATEWRVDRAIFYGVSLPSCALPCIARTMPRELAWVPLNASLVGLRIEAEVYRDVVPLVSVEDPEEAIHWTLWCRGTHPECARATPLANGTATTRIDLELRDLTLPPLTQLWFHADDAPERPGMTSDSLLVAGALNLTMRETPGNWTTHPHRFAFAGNSGPCAPEIDANCPAFFSGTVHELGYYSGQVGWLNISASWDASGGETLRFAIECEDRCDADSHTDLLAAAPFTVSLPVAYWNQTLSLRIQNPDAAATKPLAVDVVVDIVQFRPRDELLGDGMT